MTTVWDFCPTCGGDIIVDRIARRWVHLDPRNPCQDAPPLVPVGAS